MNIVKFLLISFFFLILSFSGAALQNDFTFKGEPINPACVALFNDSDADLPIVRSISLNTCQHSNKAHQKTLTDNKGYYWFNEDDPNATPGSTYGYTVVGKTANGIYVLQTSSSWDTGSSGDLLLVKLSTAKTFDLGPPFAQRVKLTSSDFTLLTLLGVIPAASECKAAKVVGNTLIMTTDSGQAPSRAEICNYVKDYELNLNEIGA